MYPVRICYIPECVCILSRFYRPRRSITLLSQSGHTEGRQEQSLGKVERYTISKVPYTSLSSMHEVLGTSPALKIKTIGCALVMRDILGSINALQLTDMPSRE